MKGTSTPVQCASTDLTVDPLTGHLLLRDTTPSGVTINVEIGASDVPVAATPFPGRKLLAGDSHSRRAARCCRRRLPPHRPCSP